MPKFSHIQHSFTAGELSPKLLGRTDLKSYRDGFQDGQNMVVNKEGGVHKRPGTKFLKKTFSVSTKIKRLDVTNPWTIAQHDATGGAVNFDDCHVRLIPFEVTNSLSGVIIIGRDSSGRTLISAIRDDGSEPATISVAYSFHLDSAAATYVPVPFEGYTNDDLDNLQFSTSGNFINIVCINQPPIWVGVANTTTGVFNVDIYDLPSFPSTVADFKVWPYQDYVLDATITNIVIVGAGPEYTITGSFATGADNDLTNHYLKVHLTAGAAADKDKVFFIKSVTNLTTAIGLLVSGSPTFTATILSDQTAEMAWAHSAFGDNVKRKFPATNAIYKQKIIYGGNEVSPETLWGSRTGDLGLLDRQGLIEDIDPVFGTVVADDPINYTVANDSSEAAVIQWMSSGKQLNIGTIAREVNASGLVGQDINGDANSISISAETAQGSVLVQGKRDANRLHFVDRSGQRIRRYTFDFNDDAFRAEEVSFNNSTLVTKNTNETITTTATKAQYIDMHFQSGTDIMWCLTNFGKLIGWTLSSEFKVEAGHYHEIGGTDTFVRSICNSGTDMYLWVERTINGGTEKYLEKLSDEYSVNDVATGNDSTSIDDKMVYSDSAHLQTLGAPAKVFNDFGHLIGETVDCVADGIYVGQKVVDASGDITLDDNATDLVAGLNYRAYIQSVPVENGSAVGSAQGSIKKIERLVIRYYRSIGCKFGPDLDNLDEIEFRDPEQAMDDPIELYTGDKKVDFHDDLDRRGEYYLVQDLPLPCHIVSTMILGLTYD